MTVRNGLQESYEQYASRAGGQSVYTHAFWRAEGLRLLNAPFLLIRVGAPYDAHPCRVAPGVAVPVRLHPFGDFMTSADVIEVEP